MGGHVFKSADGNSLTQSIKKSDVQTTIDWLEKTYKIENDKAGKSSTDKSIINKTVDFLANIYQYKRDRVRGKDAKAFDAFDAKFKEYDNLHGKF